MAFFNKGLYKVKFAHQSYIEAITEYNQLLQFVKINEGFYKVNFAHQSYIKAIAKYNPLSWIDKITDIHGKPISLSSKKRLSLSELPSIIHELSTTEIQEINVEYSTCNSFSMVGVFPTVQPQIVTHAVHCEPIAVPSNTLHDRFFREVRKLFNHEQENYSKAAEYLDRLIAKTTRTDSEGVLNIYKHEIKAPSTLTRAQTLDLIQKYSFSEAIELPALNTIVFRLSENSACIYVTYGPSCQIGPMNIALDLDDGFLFYFPESGFSAHAKNIVSVLQRHFLAWKATNYEGPLLPQSMGLMYKPMLQTPTATPSH